MTALLEPRRVGLSSLQMAGLLLVAAVLGGCSLSLYPSQSKPTCSWTTQPLPHADAVCTGIFRTLQDVLKAELAGNEAAMRRLVMKRDVASRILAYRRVLRVQHVHSLHIVPSFTLDGSRPQRIGAVFFLVGTGAHGSLRTMETVYLRPENGEMVIVADVPGEEW